MRRILLLNPNTTLAYTEMMVRAARAVAPPGTTVDGATVAQGVPLIRNAHDFEAAAAAVAAFAERVPAGIDGLIVAAFADPGLEVLRDRLAIPAVGIAEASIGETGDRRFAVATTLPDLDAIIRRRVAACSALKRLVSIRTPAGDGAALMRDPAALTAALAATVHACIADGAEAVIIGGGPLADAAAALRERAAVPIIAPIPAAVNALAAR